METPTLFKAKKDIGEEHLLILLTAAVNECMDLYFNDQNRLTSENATSFAESLMEDYQMETVGDVKVFFKRASQGRYGEVNGNGDVTKRGQIVGRMALSQLGNWWQQYLAEKEAEREVVQGREKEPSRGVPLLDDKVLVAMKEAAIGSPSKAVWDAVGRLKRLLPLASEEKLRDLWEKYPHEIHRRMILDEADSRGLPRKKKDQTP